MGNRSAGAYRLSSEPAKLAEDEEFAFSSAYRPAAEDRSKDVARGLPSFAF